MKKPAIVLSVAVLIAVVAYWTVAVAQQGSYQPKRINKAVELLEQGQPIYYTATRTGGYEEGVKMAQTWADYINYEMEHGSFDFSALRAFMQGLVKGGPTKSGHRTPAVIVTLPVLGLDEASMWANSWVIQQTLAAGVHGILLCYARDPKAVRVFVASARYPFHKQSVGPNMLAEGLRGSGSQGFASQIWGISPAEYLEKADVWPLNPNGEILLGLKIEDRYALENAEESTKVPGIAFAEWGPGDMLWSLVGNVPRGGSEDAHPEMKKARARVLAATKAAKIHFLNSVNADNVEEMIKEGVMVGAGNQAAAERGRKFTKRQMPW